MSVKTGLITDPYNNPTPGMIIKKGSLMVIQIGNENLIEVNTLLISWSLGNLQCYNHQGYVLKPQ